MTTMTPEQRLKAIWQEPKGLLAWLSTVDHKRLGVRYIVTAFGFFVLAGLEALVLRTQLLAPRNELVSPETYDQLFSMHGITMIFLFATPMLSGFGNYLVPLMLGARDMAFPRLNAFGYWVFLLAGLFLYGGLALGQAPNDGWFNYVPLASNAFSPDRNIDYYGLGLLFLAISTTAGAINFIVTILKLRAPGMSVNRIPLFCWAVLVTSFAIVFALPALTAANLLLELQRKFGFHFYDVAGGGDPLLWQHLFWIFGHPDVYIIFLPAVGIVSSIVPTFSRRPMVGYTWVAMATATTGIIGFGVWVHHMFATGLPQITMAFFALASMVIVIPSGIQIFAWLATMLSGRPVLRTPFLYVLGFVVVFVVGGLTGVMFAVIPFDQQVTDSYFVVAHFHYVLFGGAVFPMLAGIHYWLPKMSGRMFSETAGRIGFALVFVGFNLTFFPMHIAGLLGMPRRVYTYTDGHGWQVYNVLATAGSYMLAVGLLVVVGTVLHALRRGAAAGPDPWGGDTLEWTTSSPPAPYAFAVIPTVRSAHPAWDLRERAEDERRLERDELTLTDGHQTLATTELDADPNLILSMPGESLSPLLLALSLLLVVVALLADHALLALAGGALVLASFAGWHVSKEEAL